MANINMKLPNITDEKLDSAKERKEIKDYLYQLTEQLRFVLNNIDEENLSDDVKSAINEAKNTSEVFQKEIKKVTEQGVKLDSRITQTAEAIQTEVNRASQAEENLSSSITQTAESISLKVDKNGVISAINQTAEEVQISANKINLDGAVTVGNRNGTSTVDTTQIVDGHINTTYIILGDLDGEYGVIDSTQVYTNLVTLGILRSNNAGLPIQVQDNMSCEGITCTSINADSHYHSGYASSSHSHSSWDIVPSLTSSNNIWLNGSVNAASVTYCQNTFVRLDGSDLRLKQDIISVDDSIDNFFFNLKPKKYKFKPINDGSDGSPENDGQTHFGLIAQEVKANLVNNGLQDDFAIIQTRPVISYSNEGLYVNDEVMRVEYKELITPTIYEVQKMNDKIKQQETRISNLETELATIKEILARNNIM